MPDTQQNLGIAEEKQTLDKVVISTDTPILSVKTVFPFTFFPDTVSAYRLKVDIVYHHFFFSYSVFTILVDDLVSAKLSTNLFFASLKFELKNFEKNPEPVNFIPVKKAIQLTEIINGLIAARNAKIDLAALSDQELYEKILPVGQAENFKPQKI